MLSILVIFAGWTLAIDAHEFYKFVEIVLNYDNRASDKRLSRWGIRL